MAATSAVSRCGQQRSLVSSRQVLRVDRMALPRLDRVRSPRSTALLHTLAADLRRRRRNQTVADLLPELENALARHPS